MIAIVVANHVSGAQLIAGWPVVSEVVMPHLAERALGCQRGHRGAGSGLPNQDGTGIEQIEAPALRVLLGLRSWLGDDDGDVAASSRGVGEPGRQQCGV